MPTAVAPPSGSPLRLSIVIPTLNEGPLVEAAVAAARHHADEVVISDGGSTDGTVELAHRLGVTLASGSPGRGLQLNRGAAAARGDILLFLHADTLLPEGAGEKVRAAIDSGALGGGFLVRWSSARGIYRLGERIVNLRTRVGRAPLGDQAQFCSRRVFEELGGFRDWPILEDLDFARRLRRAGRVALLETPVETSTRRFERGGLTRTIATNWLIFTLYFAGVSPHRLARLYRSSARGR